MKILEYLKEYGILIILALESAILGWLNKPKTAEKLKKIKDKYIAKLKKRAQKLEEKTLARLKKKAQKILDKIKAIKEEIKNNE